MKIKKKRLEVIVHNLLDVLCDEMMCNDIYFDILKQDIGLSDEEIKELGANIWN